MIGDNMANILTNAITETFTIGKEPESKSFHIALTGTANYIPYLGIVALSAAKANPSLPITFHFFLNGLDDIEQSRLTCASEAMDDPIIVHLLDDHCFEPLVVSGGIAAIFYRFLVAPALKGVTDRVLYLDGDMLVRDDLSYLADLDFKENVVAVVTDRGESKKAKRVGTKHYFNAGMMLINVDEWMRQGLFDDVVHRAEQGKDLPYHDQDIYNQMFEGKSLYLAKKYNYLYNFDRKSFFQKQPRNEDWRKQTILHFAGHAKPWHSWVQKWDVIEEYNKVQAASPWADVPLVPAKNSKHIHQAARTARMQGQYDEMLSWYWKYLRGKF